MKMSRFTKEEKKKLIKYHRQVVLTPSTYSIEIGDFYGNIPYLYLLENNGSYGVLTLDISSSLTPLFKTWGCFRVKDSPIHLLVVFILNKIKKRTFRAGSLLATEEVTFEFHNHDSSSFSYKVYVGKHYKGVLKVSLCGLSDINKLRNSAPDDIIRLYQNILQDTYESKEKAEDSYLALLSALSGLCSSHQITSKVPYLSSKGYIEHV